MESGVGFAQEMRFFLKKNKKQKNKLLIHVGQDLWFPFLAVVS